MTKQQKILQALREAGSAGELWKPVDGYEKFYLISNYGRVKTIPHGVIRSNNIWYTAGEKYLNPTPSKKGYLRVGLYNNKSQIKKPIHRLVAIAFLPNPQNLPQVNHKDGHKRNNKVSNLEWCSNLQNENHAKKLGLFLKGEEVSASKLTNQQVIEIRKRHIPFKYGYTTSLAKEYGIHPDTLRAIVNKDTWKHI